jgi:uncharacterized membrane protein HdeD (DUF308 family)
MNTVDVAVVEPRHWWALVLLGVVQVAAGIVAIAYPGLTLLVLGLIFGINVLFAGMIMVMVGTDEGSEASRVLRVVVGFLAVLAGLFMIVHPGESVLVLLLAVAFFFVLIGIADLSRAMNQKEGRILSAVLGLITIAAGIILVADPDIGLETLALLAGIAFIVRGTLELVAGFLLARA